MRCTLHLGRLHWIRLVHVAATPKRLRAKYLRIVTATSASLHLNAQTPLMCATLMLQHLVFSFDCTSSLDELSGLRQQVLRSKYEPAKQMTEEAWSRTSYYQTNAKRVGVWTMLLWTFVVRSCGRISPDRCTFHGGKYALYCESRGCTLRGPPKVACQSHVSTKHPSRSSKLVNVGTRRVKRGADLHRALQLASASRLAS